MLPSQPATRYTVLHYITGLLSSIFRAGIRRKSLCLALALSLIILPSNLAARQLSIFASSTVSVTVEAVSHLSFAFRWLFDTASVSREESLADRLTYVSYLHLSPRKFVGFQGQSVYFSALPTDYSDRTIQGVTYSWESSDPDRVAVDESGKARLLGPGIAWITCRAGVVTKRAPILVLPGARPIQTDQQWFDIQRGLREDGTIASLSSKPTSIADLLPTLLDKLSPTAHAQTYPSDFAYDEMWSEPRNLVGSPGNRITDGTRLGTVMPEGSNLSLAIPIIGLSGRGVGAGLTLHYDSRVWSRRNASLAFDGTNGWPAPGFTLGFGRIVVYDVGLGGNPNCKFMLIEPDGTRRYLGSGTWLGGSSSPETTDGSHIVYVGNGPSGGTVWYTDGTSVNISPVNNQLLATRITDSNGNFIQIAYMPECIEEGGQTICGRYPAVAIDYVTDTLGRVIDFNYDPNGKLTSITAPDFGGTSQNPMTRTVAQFDYQDFWPSTSFSGLTVERLPQTNRAIKHVYFPATSTGYRMTYSQYGMIYNFSMRRDMSLGGWPVSIQSGVESANMTLNYPTAPASLTGAPAFTQRIETATNAPTAIYTYSSSTDTVAQTKTYTVTRPDSSTLNLTRSTNSSLAANGLMVRSEVKSSAGASFAKTVIGYANDPGGSVQAQSVTSYDDANTPTKVDYDYDAYGNVTNTREYGDQISGQWQVRKRTRNTYNTATAYVNAYLRNLVTLTEVMDAQQNTNDADDIVIAKASYTYDNYTAMGGMEVYTGQPSPPGHDGRGSTYTTRGNVTGTTQWIDIVANTSITRLSKLDKYGNIVKQQVSCCNDKTYTCGQNTCWAQPEEVTDGNTSGNYLTRVNEYDFNTSAVKKQKDPNNLEMTYGYDAAMRKTYTIAPTGAESLANYNDAALSSSRSVMYDDGGTQKTVTATAETDGWGRVIKTVSSIGAQVNTAYDSMGRVSSVTNPFPQGQTPAPAASYTYDTLGRATVTTLPGGNTVQMAYSGDSVTITDQVNRKIKRETDGLGRLVKVTEQDVAGALTQETSYTYDLLDRLIGVNQGGQLRAYRYDALGRLLFERIPEQTATINDGTGTLWTTKYTYTDFDAVLTRTDARGVITTYGHDTMNRLTSISYNTSGATGVATTPDINFIIDNNQTSATTGLLTHVQIGGSYWVSGGYEESYGYDTTNRISSTTRKANTAGVVRTYTTSYQYNEASQVKQLTYPSTRAVSVSYDSQGRISSMAGYVSSVSYNTIGQVSGVTLANDVVEGYGYDSNRLQMTSQTAIKGATSLMNLTYSNQASAGQMGAGSTAGNAGQLMSISGTINSITESGAYTYDLQGRLITSSQTTNGMSAQRRIEYDRWGNRTGVWDTTTGGTQIQSASLQQSGGAPTNRLTSVTNGSVMSNYDYDNAGNVTSDGAHSYTYDAEDRLVKVDNGATAEYGYDHENRRYKKVAGGATTHYIWEGSQAIAEHNTSGGAVIADYVYSGSRMVARVQSGVTRYYLSDRLSARVVTDASGNLIGRQAHLPFGEETGSSGEQEKHRFTSYDRDAESGLDYAINRYYSVNPGRFASVDPLSSSARLDAPQSHNRYSYAHNEPLNQVDPLGLLPTREASPGEPAHLVGIVARWDDHEHGDCPAWQHDCSPSGYSHFFSEIASPFDMLEAFRSGTVSIQSSCQNAIYLPENPSRSGAEGWEGAGGEDRVDCDAVATPKGIVKIPNGCHCDLKCSGGENYKLECACLLRRFTSPIRLPRPIERVIKRIEPPRTLRAGQEFDNPKDAGYFWVPDVPLYTRSEGVIFPPGSGVPNSFEFYIFD